MRTIKEIYKEGYGPSSSHTMGPSKAAEMFLNQFSDAHFYKVTLYGSLAATGKGHLTDEVIKAAFEGKKYEIIWEPKVFLSRHPNALKFEAFYLNCQPIVEWTAYSIGGGMVVDDNYVAEADSIYPHTTMDDILKWCNQNGKQIWEYVEEYEGIGIWDFLRRIWEVMTNSVENGLGKQGFLPGRLNLPRKSRQYYMKAKTLQGDLKDRAMLFAYTLAVSEENASGGKIVTAPTCGACGVLPGVLYFLRYKHQFSIDQIVKSLATAGLIGNLVKWNASISGAEVGCQGEVGTACSMASGAITQLFDGNIYQIEYAAEMGMEHHLGLTCDPVVGLVQIPCIERNAFAASRALSHNSYALLSDGRHNVSFDRVVQAMKQTGYDLSHIYKETSEGGLSFFYSDFIVNIPNTK